MMVLRVLTEAGVPSRRVIPVTSDVLTIGRSSESTIRLVEHTASKVHAKLVRFDGRLVLRDLKSRNGTYVNGERVVEKILRDGDVVRVGATTFRVSESATARQGARTPPEGTDLAPVPQAPQRATDSATFRAPAQAGLARLRRLAAAVRAVGDPLELMTVLLNQAIDVFGADRGALVVLEEASAKPTLRVDADRDPEEPDQPIDISAGPLRAAISSYAVRTVEAGLGSPAAQRHMLAVPLATRSALVGAVVVDRGPGHSPFTPVDVEIAEVFSLVAGHGVWDALSGAEPLSPPQGEAAAPPPAGGADGLESQLIPRGSFAGALPGAFGGPGTPSSPSPEPPGSGSAARGPIPTPAPRPALGRPTAITPAPTRVAQSGRHAPPPPPATAPPAAPAPPPLSEGDDSGARNLPRPPFA